VQFRPWHTAALLVVALVPCAPLPSWAQAAMAQPVLHRRINNEEEIDIGTRSTGRSTLPPDASGTYQFGSGGAIEVELQPNRLSGYITRLGDRASDEGTPLTFFFATSRLSGQRLSFTTRQVHGVWFSFEGTIVRGPAQSRTQQGYYLLEGQLVLHDPASGTEQPRMVSLPLARQSTNG
jgi:hypothetical protein